MDHHLAAAALTTLCAALTPLEGLGTYVKFLSMEKDGPVFAVYRVLAPWELQPGKTAADQTQIDRSELFRGSIGDVTNWILDIPQ